MLDLRKLLVIVLLAKHLADGSKKTKKWRSHFLLNVVNNKYFSLAK